ncbi:hypothetical protein B0H13DRAFT_2374436 [Mycena leptocephala]|nr:hypothetical protein B0H13DRAFT_2374436 [Mycena leptocephala]
MKASGENANQATWKVTSKPEAKRTPIPIPSALCKNEGYELQATEFLFAVIFPSSSGSHFELTLKDPAKWDGIPIHPEVTNVRIKCTNKNVVDSPTYAAVESNTYSVQYQGAQIRRTIQQLLPLDPTRGIAIDMLSLRTYAVPGLSNAVPGLSNSVHREWEIQFCVPIAVRLFDTRETRLFQMEAAISVWGQKLQTEMATISVSHLRWERERARWLQRCAPSTH